MAQSIVRPRKSSTKLLVKKPSRKRVSKDRFAKLEAKVTPLLRPYANRISVFGSFARGEDDDKSDIDLLISLKPAETRPALGLLEFIKLEQELKEKLGRDVDLVTEEELNPRRKQNIEKDRVVLYEAK